MAINGDIVGKDRIDACGEIVDGWRIASSQTFTSATGERSVTDTTYFVSTQLGGLVTLQARKANSAVPSADPSTITDHLGQLVPTPIG
jgi:hypothetical protein